MGNVETFRSKAMKTYLVVSYVIVSCIFFSPGNLFADENTERALAAENKMLRAAIDNLKAEIAKLKTEIKQLKEPPKQSKPVDSNSSKVVASPNTQPTSSVGNDVFAKAFLKYLQSDKTTTAKQQEAYKLFFKESSVSVTIAFTVGDISSYDNSISAITSSKGIITTSSLNTGPPIEIRISGPIAVKMSGDLASKIDKGNKFTVTGVFERGKGDGSNTGHNSLELQVTHITHNGVYAIGYISNPVITLNGKVVELAK